MKSSLVKGMKIEKYTLIRETHRFRLGKTSQGLYRLWDEGEGSRGGGILGRQRDMKSNQQSHLTTSYKHC